MKELAGPQNCFRLQSARGHKHRSCTACQAATEESTRAPADIEEAQKQAPKSTLVTGGRLGGAGSGRQLLPKDELPLKTDKQIVLVRHGMSQWNIEGRIQGSSNEPELTDFGRQQVRNSTGAAYSSCLWLSR